MNKLKIFIFSTLVWGSTACEQVLDQLPQTSVVSEIKDASTARAALNGAYNGLQSANYIGTRYQLLPDLQSGNLRHTGTFSDFAEIANRSVLTNNTSVTGMWTQIYTSILRDNFLIKYVPSINESGFTDAAKNQIVAEAKFLRAFNYFNLVRWWGDVPLVLDPTEQANESLKVSRSSTADVYKQIYADIDAALPYLPTTNKGKATKNTALALKARAALYQKDYAAVVSLCDQIIASGQHSLVPTFSNIFATQGTAESIWELSFETTNSNTLAFFLFSTALGGRNEIRPNTTLASAYSTTDARRILTTSYDAQLKYFRINGTDFPVLFRYAEVILNRAEALAELGRNAEALTALNLIRNRAGIGDADATLVTNPTALKTEIFTQRRLELALEGHYFFDLVRTGRAAATLSNWASTQALLPIPQRERDSNPNITQNPGY